LRLRLRFPEAKT